MNIFHLLFTTSTITSFYFIRKYILDLRQQVISLQNIINDNKHIIEISNKLNSIEYFYIEKDIPTMIKDIIKILGKNSRTIEFYNYWNSNFTEYKIE